MQRYHSWAQDQFGNAVGGATITVLLSGTSTPATIYDEATATIPNANGTITTASDGYYAFAAENDRYDIRLSGTGFADKTMYGIYLYDGLTGTAGTGTVTSVALVTPSFLTTSGSPVTGAGTFTVTLATQAANKVFAGPTTGADAAPTFRSLVSADLTGLVSIPVTVPGFMGVTTTPLGPTTTLALTVDNQSANLVFAGPASGGAAAPDFRALVAADYPTFVQSGGSHAKGAVPDPPSSAGTAKFLCEDATWKIVPYLMQFEMNATLSLPNLNVTTAEVLTPSGLGSLTIPANTLKVGSRIIINAQFLLNTGSGVFSKFAPSLGSADMVGATNFPTTTTGETINRMDVTYDYLVTSATAVRMSCMSLYRAGALRTSSVYSQALAPSTYSSFDITASQTIACVYDISGAAITSGSLERFQVIIYNPA
jgi:hypothetical protein